MHHPHTFRPPASHPRRCRVCAGTGWQDGPPIVDGLNTYSTVEPCTHDWRDDPADPYYDHPVLGDSRCARAAFAQGYAAGLADRDLLEYTDG